MSRKDFELIARVVRNTYRNADQNSARKALLVQNFVDELKATNGNFNADRFITACYGE